MSAEGSAAPVLGVRERKKQERREAIVTAADTLFAARGYDAVTVAEIAAAAGVSVKTLFTYFRSKEDLLFAGEETLLDRLLRAVRGRAGGETPLSAMAAALRDAVQDTVRNGSDDPDGLEAFHRTVGTSAAVASRLRRMWEQYELALTRALADERNEARPSPETRLAAAQLIAMVRIITSQEVRDFVAAHRSEAAQVRALTQWIDRAAAQIGQGLGDYGERER
jgi:AcrR family transcriptional regulator